MILSSKRVVLLWTLLFLAFLGVVAPFVAGVSALDLDDGYDESYIAYEVLCFVTAFLCFGLCIFALRILCINDEDVLVRLTPYWIVYSIVTLVFGVLVLFVGLSSFDQYEDDLFIWMGAGIVGGTFSTFGITLFYPCILAVSLACTKPRQENDQEQLPAADDKGPILVIDGPIQDVNLGQEAA
jgi:cell division protein FtsW (lipid II flippase)